METNHAQSAFPAVPGETGLTRKGGSRVSGLLALGGILGAVGASSCCVLPLVLFGLGIGGAWIGSLTALAPYQPFFIAAALGFLGLGFWRVYSRQADCDGPACTRPMAGRLVKIGLGPLPCSSSLPRGFPMSFRSCCPDGGGHDAIPRNRVYRAGAGIGRLGGRGTAFRERGRPVRLQHYLPRRDIQPGGKCCDRGNGPRFSIVPTP
jgi:mercuric ion transport protein